MDDYQNEQLLALSQTMDYLYALSGTEFGELKAEIAHYLEFRNRVEQFLSSHCSHYCTRSCYTRKTSACCSKNGIITFWADVLVNACASEMDQLSALSASIRTPTFDQKCIFLDTLGCRWQVRPLVCAMFLCDPVEKEVMANNVEVRTQWRVLNTQAKSFRWPDRPVLFDTLEKRCMAAGIQSPLMYLNNSPGLLHVKKKAGLL